MNSQQTVLEKYQDQLKQAYEKINQQKIQYVSSGKVKQWVYLVFQMIPVQNLTNHDRFQENCKQNFDILIEQYLTNVHKLNSDIIKQPQFKYQECIDFLSWLIYQKFRLQQEKNQIQQLQKAQNNVIQITGMKNSSKFKQQSIKNNMKQNQNHLNTNIKNEKSQVNNIQLKNHKVNKQLIKDQNQNQNQQVDQQQIQFLNKKIISKNNQINLSQLQQKYKEYLQIIFQHYCKQSYATGQDPTFQSIQKKITIMTINKFMIFCKQFEIGPLISSTLSKNGKQKITKNTIRNQLMEIFKKNSQFYKQMSFQQFVQTLTKISQIVFSKMKQIQIPEDITQSQKISYQMIKLLEYLQIATFKDFKEKMIKLHINYQTKTNKQLQKKAPINYKFKFQPTTDKEIPQTYNKQQSSDKNTLLYRKNQPQINEKQVAKQLKKRIVGQKLSQNNIRTKQKVSVQKNNTRPDTQKNILSSKNLRNAHSFKDDNRHIIESKTKNNLAPLAPIVPPQRKVSQNPNISTSSTPNIPQAMTGYAKIHLAKKGVLKQIEAVTNYQTPISISRKKGQFQLNNIVQQARHIVHYDKSQTRSGRTYSNTHSMKPPPSLYSRDQNSSYNNYPPSRDMYQTDLIMNGTQINNINGYGNKRAIHNRSTNQNSRIRVQNQLGELLDLNQSDQDQFLMQHLKKQSGNDINARIDKKISMLNSNPL